MIFKPISDLVQLDQSKISDGMLLVRSGAENDAKDYKLTISNLLDSIEIPSEGITTIDSTFFQNGGQLNFSNIYCSGSYAEKLSGGATISFGLNTPYLLDPSIITNFFTNQIVSSLTIKVSTVNGESYFVYNNEGSNSFTSLNDNITIIENFSTNSNIGIGAVQIARGIPHSFQIIITTTEKIRTNQSTPETYLTSNTPCTVYCSLTLKKRNDL